MAFYGYSLTGVYRPVGHGCRGESEGRYAPYPPPLHTLKMVDRNILAGSKLGPLYVSLPQPSRRRSLDTDSPCDRDSLTLTPPGGADSGYASDNESTGHHTPPKRQKSVDSVGGGQSKQAAVDCQVCGERAQGKFFGAHVCLPCKTFFIRCTTEELSNFVCRRGDGQCEVTSQTRSRCKYCRYQRCIQKGMIRRERPEKVEAGEGQTLCAVCGDVANGVHFGVVSCEGCKKFFRRGLREYETYHCRLACECVINPRTRNECRYCRFQACLKAGMSRNAIRMGRPRKDSSDPTHTQQYRGISPRSSSSGMSPNTYPRYPPPTLPTEPPGLTPLLRGTSPASLNSPNRYMGPPTSNVLQHKGPIQNSHNGLNQPLHNGLHQPHHNGLPRLPESTIADDGRAIENLLPECLNCYENFLQKFYSSQDDEKQGQIRGPQDVAQLSNARLKSHISAAASFARSIDGFQDLCADDQFQILHECTIPLCLIIICCRGNQTPRNSFLDISYPHGHPLVQFQLQLQEFATEVSQFRLDKMEQFLLSGLVLTSVEESKVKNKDKYRCIRQKFMDIFTHYNTAYANNPLHRRHVLTSKILLRLRELGKEHHKLSLKITVPC